MKNNREWISTLRSLDIRGKPAGTRKRRVSPRYKGGRAVRKFSSGTGGRFYSYRNATIGSTFIARLAGT